MVCRNFTILTLFLSLLNYSCQQQGTDLVEDSGNLILRLTDAPFPHNKVSEVNVTISAIKLEAEEATFPVSTSESGLSNLLESPVEVNLLQLTNGVTISLLNNEMHIGRYKKMYIYLKKVEITLSDETVFDMIPRADPVKGSEIMLPVDFTVSPGLTTDLLLDFDVSRSFTPRMSPSANMGIAGFLFSPVLHLTDNLNTGSISGIVTSSLKNQISRIHGAQVSVISADTLVTTTFTDEAGMYTVLGLKPGNYRVEAEFEDLRTSSKEPVAIQSDKTAQQSLDLKAEAEVN